MTKIVSQLDELGYFVEPAVADENTKSPGTYILPFGCVDFPPPNLPEGKRALWTGEGFTVEDIPAPPPPPPPAEPTAEELALRYEAFLKQVRTLRETAINRLMGIAGRAERAGSPAVAQACDTAAESLLGITSDLPVDLEQAEGLIVQRWQQTAEVLSQSAPTAVSAFMGLEF